MGKFRRTIKKIHKKAKSLSFEIIPHPRDILKPL